MPDPSLAISLCGIAMRNPVIAASGTFGYGIEFEKIINLNDLGALVTKGLSREPIAGNPAPRLWHTEAGMMNSVGLQNVGVRAFVAEKLPKLEIPSSSNRKRVRLRDRRLFGSYPLARRRAGYRCLRAKRFLSKHQRRRHLFFE